jgi:hypothetical protein
MTRLSDLIALGASACAPVGQTSGPPSRDEVLLTMLFEDARSIEQQLAPDFSCVSLRAGNVDTDPPLTVIDALAKRWRSPVLPGSKCKIVEDGAAVSAPGVSGSGKWLRIAKLQCPSADHCTADVSYYVANLGAGGRGVAIDRTSAGWKITPSGAMWIS